MKQQEHARFAAYLLDELGGIEDRYLAEAQIPCRATRQTPIFRRVLIVALSLALTLTVVLSALLIGSLRGAKSEDHAALGDELAPGTEQVLNQFSGATATTLSDRLGELRASTESLQIAEEELNLFDGQAKVIWQYAEEETVRVQSLTPSEYRQLTQTLDRETHSKTDGSGEGEKTLAGIWLAAGDGTVISPQLEQTAGNVGYGALFTYRPETEPSTAFTELLCDILSSVGNANGKDGRS